MSRLVTYSPSRIREMNFKSYEFDGKWKDLLGCPSENFSSVIYGKSRSGKSTLCITFSQYLAETFGKKILYVLAEEGVGRTIQDRINICNITSDKIRFVKLRKLEEIENAINRIKPRFIFIDTAQRCGLTIKDFLRLKDSQGRKVRSWNIILQVNHNGQIDGKHKWIHETDIEINCIDGIAYADGRFKQQGMMKVLDKKGIKQLNLF